MSSAHIPDNSALADYAPRLEAMARDYGLDFYPVNFELVPDSFMTEVAVYGLPVRMPHWSFGVRYIYQYVQHRMGHSRIFEVVFPGNPNRAYMQSSNQLAENTLVTAHVYGHADFSRNNALFLRMQEEAGYHIVEQAARRARWIEEAIERHGHKAVDRVLDAALALEQCIDIGQPLIRPPLPTSHDKPAEQAPPKPGRFQQRFHALPGEELPEPVSDEKQPFPIRPEKDLLWFIARYSPDMADWERDIFLAVREESWYFYPLFACQIMNEGWASYWHARLLREADFLPHDCYLDAIKTHSDVVRPWGGEEQVSLRINPYHLGFCMWESIIESKGLEAAFRIRREEDDFSFIRNHLSEELAGELQLFRYREVQQGRSTRYAVQESDIHELRENILAPRFNYGAPRVHVREMGHDGSLHLQHDSDIDGRGLDLESAEKVLEYIHQVWRRPVYLRTLDAKDQPRMLTVGEPRE
jgi:stage V sporulation protein R